MRSGGIRGDLQDAVEADEGRDNDNAEHQSRDAEELNKELVFLLLGEFGVGGIGRHDQAAAGGSGAQAGKGGGERHDGDQAVRGDADFRRNVADGRNQRRPHDTDGRAEPGHDAGGQTLDRDGGTRGHDGGQRIGQKGDAADVDDGFHQG